MSLKDLIATPGEAAASRITKQFRYSGTAHEDLYAAIVEAVNSAVAAEREACAKIADEGAYYGTAEGAEDMAKTIARLIRARTED